MARGQAGQRPQATANVTPIQQTQPTHAPHQGKTVLPDLTAEQIIAAYANLKAEEKAKVDRQLKAPKYDTEKLLDIKAELQAIAAEKLQAMSGKPIDGEKAFGIIWKAAWPKKYYKTHEVNGSVQRVVETEKPIQHWIVMKDKKPVRTIQGNYWLPGGPGQSKPDWIDNGNFELVRVMKDGSEVVENAEPEEETNGE